MNTPLELADAFIQAGELQDALAALDEHLQAHPDGGDAHRLRANVLMRLPGRACDALADLDAIPIPAAEDDMLRFSLLEMAGERAAAFTLAERMWTRRRELRSAEIFLCLLYERGEIERALSLLADQPKTWRWLGWGGDFYALRGDDSIAVEHYCSALDQLDQVEKNALIETQRATLLLKRAHAYQRLKLFADADLDYRAAEAIIPNDPTIPFQRGLLTFEQGDLPGAFSLCRVALDRAPGDLRDHMHNMLRDDPRYQALAQALLS